MTRPQDMGPGDLAPNNAPPETLTAEQAARVRADSYYNGLPPADKDAFLAALADAAERGLDENAAWREAVIAVEERI